MSKTQFYAAASAMVILCEASCAAQAAQYTYVSGNGTGSSPCARATPCSDLQTAILATDVGGTVIILAPTRTDGPTISKSLTVRAELNDSGAFYPGPSSGPLLTISAGANDVVNLQGLTLDGGGVDFKSGQHLHIGGCKIINNAYAGEAGIRFRPSSASKLSVTDTVIDTFGLNTGGGIVVSPLAGGSARVNLERVAVNGNAFGIALDGGSSNGINATISESMIGGNAQDGIIATTSSAPIGVFVTNSKSVNNNFGIRSLGNNVTVRVDNSKIVGNVTGLSFANGGTLLSAGNNLVQANSTNGSFSGSVPMQ